MEKLPWERLKCSLCHKPKPNRIRELIQSCYSQECLCIGGKKARQSFSVFWTLGMCVWSLEYSLKKLYSKLLRNCSLVKTGITWLMFLEISDKVTYGFPPDNELDSDPLLSYMLCFYCQFSITIFGFTVYVFLTSAPINKMSIYSSWKVFRFKVFLLADICFQPSK